MKKRVAAEVGSSRMIAGRELKAVSAGGGQVVVAVVQEPALKSERVQ